MTKRIVTTLMAAIGWAAAASTAWAGETAFEFIGCGISKNVVVEASPELTVQAIENWAINTSTAVKDWEKATKHCVGYVRIMDGKPTGKGACKWQDATGGACGRVEPGCDGDRGPSRHGLSSPATRPATRST